MPGIADGNLFELNVRLPLGSTKVNKAIRESIEQQTQHVKFPLFHNGITVLAEKVTTDKGSVTIENFVVVNGAQSLKQFSNGQKKISSDLKVLTRIIEIGGNTELAREISINSNNQNGIKPRDLRSNDAVQVRLQSEFEKLASEGYSFDVKRGEEGVGRIITNEFAGKLLLAFDLDARYILPFKLPRNFPPWGKSRRKTLSPFNWRLDSPTGVVERPKRDETSAYCSSRIALVILRRMSLDCASFPRCFAPSGFAIRSNNASISLRC